MRNTLRGWMMVVLLATPFPAWAQERSLAAARELYVAAEYGSALTMLTQLGDTAPDAERQSVDLYRVLCLTALGNAAEATHVIESMLTADPLYRPDGADLPPRVRTAFSDARKRLLPNLVQQRYVVARAAYEQKEYLSAAEGFKFVMNGLSDPDMSGPSAQPPLADLKVLASGFHDLAAKAATPPEPPAAEPKIASAVSTAQVAVEPPIYGADDTDVVPPQTIRQSVPPFPGRVTTAGVATIDVIITESGRVEAASIVTSLNPQYDRMALNAAKSWQYQPATLNGVPVKYRKRLQLTLVPDPPRR